MGAGVEGVRNLLGVVFVCMGVTSTAAASEEGRVLDGVVAFERFYRAQRDRTVRFAFLLTGDRSAAEDVAAEAFARVYRKWRTVRIDNADGYLRRVVVNEVRSRGRRQFLDRRERHGRGVTAVRSAGSERVVDHHVLVEALVLLPVHQRAPIVLRYFEDLSEADTARLLGWSVGAVKSSVSRGLTRLREIVGEDGT